MECTECKKIIKKNSYEKHNMRYHASIENKRKYYGKLYCETCNYGILQKDKFSIHLSSKNHIENINKLLNLDKTISNRIELSMREHEIIFQQTIIKLLNIHKDFEFNHKLLIYKLIKDGNMYIKSSSKLLDKIISKYKTQNANIIYLKNVHVKSRIERWLYEDYYRIIFKNSDGYDDYFKTNIAETLSNPELNINTINSQVIKKINSYSNVLSPIKTKIIALYNLAIININISLDKNEINWIDTSKDILLYNKNLYNCGYYEINENNITYNFDNVNRLNFDIVEFSGIYCLYEIYFFDGTKMCILRRYEDNTIKLINKFVNPYDNLTLKIINTENKFKMRLLLVIRPKNNEGLNKLRAIINNLMNIDYVDNIFTYLEIDDVQKDALLNMQNQNIAQLSVDEINDKKKLIKKRGAKVKHTTKEDKIKKQREQQKINREKKNKKNAKSEIILNDAAIEIFTKKCTHPVTNILNEHNKIRHLNILKTLIAIGINIDNYDQNEQNKIIQEYKNKSTLRSYLTTIKYYLLGKKIEEENIKFLINTIDALIISIKFDSGKKKLTDEEKLLYITWSDAIDIKEKLYNEHMIINDKDSYAKYLYICLFTMMPPRRLTDYMCLILDTNQKIYSDPSNILVYYPNGEIPDEYIYDQVAVSLNKTQDDKNYLTLQDGNWYFIFNNYKTCKIYGKQIVKVSTKLEIILADYIKFCKLSNGDKVFNYPEHIMEIFMQTICKEHKNKPTSVSKFRHIFINTYFLKYPNVSYNAQLVLANLMGHSTSMQRAYDKEIEL